jgi:hypothetical protein
VARVTAEFGPLALPWWAVLVLAAICALLGAALARRVQWRVDLSPLLAVWVYVAYPTLDPGVAAGAGFVALAGTVIVHSKPPRKLQVRRASPKPVLKNLSTSARDTVGAYVEVTVPGSTVPLLVFALALILYVATLAPDLLAADNAEYQLVAHHLGVAHPPGYALYTMLGKLFALLPLHTPAWRVNFYAAVTGALALALIARTVQRLTGSAWGGLAAALALGVAPTFWAQSTTANIRSLTALFTAWCFEALVVFGQSRQRGESGQAALSWFALGLGLGMGHHLSLGMLLPAFGLYLLTADPSLARQTRRWLRPGLIFLSTFLVLAYFPVRGAMGAVLAPDHLTTLDGFLEHVLARGFGGDMFAFLSRGVLPHRFAVLGDILVFQFGRPLLIAAGLGALALLWRDRRSFLLFGFGFALFFFLIATYRAPQTVEYLMPAYVPVTVAVGCAVGAILRQRRWGPILGWLVALILLSGVLRLASHYPSFDALHHDHTARDYAESILRAAPPDAVILSNWHWWTAFQYLQLTEGLRPDVDVIYVYPQGESYAANWVACIEADPTAQPECLEADTTARPLIVTDQYNDFEALPYRFVPFRQAYLVQREPLFTPPADLTPLDIELEDTVQLIGYRLGDDALTPGQPLVVHLAWQPLSEWQHDYSFFVQLLGPTGLAGQGKDVIHPAGHYQVGEVLVDRYAVAVWPTVPPGDYLLIAGVYFTPEGGGWQRLTTPEEQDHVSLGTVRIKAPSSRPVTLHSLRHRFVNDPALRLGSGLALRLGLSGEEPSGPGLTLVGADFDHSPGQPRRVYLHWQLSAKGKDYDVQLLADGQLIAQEHLSTPPSDGYLITTHDVPDGSLSVRVQPAGGEGPAPRVGAWGFQLSRPAPLPDPAPGSRFVPLGGEMALTGVQTRRGIKLSEEERRLLRTAQGDGDILQVDLQWLSLGALTHDRVVSVQALAWGVHHDSVPALGTVPTLKWIQGAEVQDRHFLPLPKKASGDTDLHLIVYDHFTRQPLALLDDRLAKLGNMTPIEWQIDE